MYVRKYNMYGRAHDAAEGTNGKRGNNWQGVLIWQFASSVAVLIVAIAARDVNATVRLDDQNDLKKCLSNYNQWVHQACL